MTPVTLQPRLIRTATVHQSSGARLVSPGGQTLPLRRIELTSEAGGGIVRTTLRQHFHNPYATPLELLYSFPLPADGAVVGYEIRAGERVITGRVERRDEARQHFEEARLEGRTAGLVEEERPNFFTQRLGNISPSTDVFVLLTIDHKLRWIAGGEWEFRFPTVIAPRYLGAEGRVTDAEEVTVDVADRPIRPTASVALVVDGQTMSAGHEPKLDRDIVIRWPAAQPQPGCQLRQSRPATGMDAFGLLTLVPPTSSRTIVSRDLILLLDVSGSMHGTPLAHLKSVVTALIEGMTDHDHLEMVAFSSDQIRYRPEPVATTADERRWAGAWVQSLEAEGGTEMISAIGEALRPIRQDTLRQVVVVTDGLIGFESDAVRAIRDGLPPGCRLHAVGIGSAANQAFLRPAARAGRGVEVLIGLDEPAGPAAQRIAAATHEPVVIDVSVSGDALVESPRLPDLLAGSPVLAALRIRPSGGSLVVTGRTASGAWEQTLDVPAIAAGEGHESIPALWARETIEDLELELACGGSSARINQRIEDIALRHSVLSRLTSWIAIAQVPTVDPREPVRLERIPQSLPYGMSLDAPDLMFAASPIRPGMAAPMAAPPAPTHFEDIRVLSMDLAEESSLDRMTRAIGRFIAKLKRRRPASAPPLEAHGRIMPTPGKASATVEFLAQSALDWQPATVATAGTRKVDVVKQKTTRPGPVEKGTLVRLTVSTTPEAIAKAGWIGIESGPVTLIITVFSGEPD